ncbi:MAG: LTA synthase family protein [Paludibacteraceae bacterium]
MQTNRLSRLRAWFAQGNRTAWAVFLLFALVLFLKTMIFHWTCFHSVLISSLWKNPTEFIRFWGGKITPILFLGSFIFLTKRYWWTVVAHLLTDIWLIANLFYYKANTLFLSVETMKMADNMSGFWDSLLTYMGWDIFIMPILTILYATTMLLLHLYRSPIRKYPHFAITMFTSIALSVLGNYLGGVISRKYEPTAEIYSFPFGSVYRVAKIDLWEDFNAELYVNNQSIISYFPACFVYSVLSPAGEIMQLSESQRKEIDKHIIYQADKTPHIVPKTNLIFILFESLESWPLDSVCGCAYMPCLQQLKQQKHVLYADQLRSQTRHGNSADGQMIGVTGLLPISNGATCRLYGENDYPNYAHFYAHSAIANPAPNMWQQSVVTFSYHFNELIEPQRGEHWGDKGLMEKLLEYTQNQDSSFCILGITVDSHVPFAYGSTHPKHVVEGMPNIMSAYLNCLAYTDSCIGALLDAIQNSPLAENTTIVISGDHTIFRSQDTEMDRFAKENGIPMQTGHTFTPLIIYSPEIEGNVQVADTCYQMDIFPTILHLIGAEDYYWHGFGVNLLDSAARNNRPCTEQEAYHLSDLIIRSDYFRGMESKAD